MAEQDDNPFSSPSSETDLVLLVEEEKLHVSKLVLSLVSPFFKTMFEGDYKEKYSSEIPFPGKRYWNMLQFLLCVYPSTAKPVTRSNLDDVLPLADEYCVKSLKQKCEAFVLSQLQHHDAKISNPPNDVLVHFTFLGDKYKLKACVEACVDKQTIYRQYDDRGIKQLKEFDLLSSEVKLQILEKRLCLVEKPCRDILKSVEGIDPERTLKSITDPVCRGCNDPKKIHHFANTCRIRARRETAHIIEKTLKLKNCFLTSFTSLF